MQNKILFFFLSILIVTSVNGAERTLGETVEINLGDEWAKDVRARKFINKLCPAYTKDNNEEEKRYFISDISMETQKLGCVDYNTFKTNNETKDKDTSITGKIDVSYQSSYAFNVAEIDSVGFVATKETDEDAYSNKLRNIVANANSDNSKIYPLVFKNIRGFTYGATPDENNIRSHPFIGFLGIGSTTQQLQDDNYIMQAFGVKKYIDTTNDITVVGAKASEAPKLLDIEKKDNEIVNWGDIGYSIGTWIDHFSEKKNATNTISKIKNIFTWKESDEKQTWSRVMAGVAVLDDAYIKHLNEKGELIINNAKDPIISRKGFGSSIDTTKFDNLFEQTSDSKLWGFYLYLTQNLHTIEILLILSLTGITFGGTMLYNGYFWVDALRKGEDTSKIIDWKQVVFVPMLGIMTMAVPIIPSHTQLFKDFILDTDSIASEIQVNQLNVNGGKQYDENAFYSTVLQSGIQAIVTYGGALADIFSHKVSFAFSEYISFRKEVVLDPRAMLQAWKKNYNENSRDLIYLNQYLQFYLSTCKHDYSEGTDNAEIASSVSVLPQMLNKRTDNSLFNTQLDRTQKQLSSIINNSATSSIGIVTAQACAKIENEIYNRSEPLVKNMINLSREITGYSNNYIKNNGYIKDTNDELLAKIERLAFYEKNYGWVNTAMIPIMYQILFPSFNPYKFEQKINALGGYSTLTPTKYDFLINDYIVIGKPTTIDDKANQLSNNQATITYNQNDGSKNELEKIMGFGISMIVYQFLPGYERTEASIKELYTALGEDSGHKDVNGKPIKKAGLTSYITSLLIAIVADDWDVSNGTYKMGNIQDGQVVNSYAGWLGVLGGVKFTAGKAQNSLSLITEQLRNKLGKIGSSIGIPNIDSIADFLIIKIVSQIVYIYSLNLIIMIIISLVLVYKISMYFLQIIIFYMASPLVVLWSLIRRKQEYVLNYIGKASILTLTPVLIVISTTILILGVGIVQEIYAFIANHALNIQMVDINANMTANIGNAIGDSIVGNISKMQDYIQLQLLIGVGNVLVGFAYLFLGYVIIIKFTGWFFETIGVQANNMITQGLDNIGQRMTFGRSFMA